MNPSKANDFSSAVERATERMSSIMDMLNAFASEIPSIREPKPVPNFPVSAQSQEEISAHLRNRIFAPYPVLSSLPALPSASSSSTTGSAFPSSSRSRLQAFRRGNMRVSLPATPAPVAKKQKTEKKETWFFIVLGDPMENESPGQQTRLVELIEAGFGPRKIELAVDGSFTDFQEALDKFSIDVGHPDIKWKVLYTLSLKDNAPLFPVNESQVSSADLKALKKDLKVKRYFLQPNRALLSLMDDSSLESEVSADKNKDGEGLMDTTAANDITANDSDSESNSVDLASSSAAIFGSSSDMADPEIAVTVRESTDSRRNLDEDAIKSFTSIESFLQRATRKSTNYFRVNRMKSFPDASTILEAFNAPNLNPLNGLRVEYEGEDGIDAGALRQDFIWTAHGILQSQLVLGCPLFDGGNDHKTISDYEVLVDFGMYETLATFLLQSFTATGVLCPGLSRPVYNYIIGSPDKRIENFLDCPDYDDQEIARKVCTYLNNPDHLRKAELETLRQDLANLQIKFPLVEANRGKILYAVYKQAIFVKRKRALDIVKSRISLTPTAIFLRNNPALYSTVCPKEDQMNPSPESIMRNILNADDPEIQPIAACLLNFLENISSHGHKTSDFLKLTTARPVLSGLITIKLLPPRAPISASSCLRELRVPANVDQKAFNDKMKQVLGAEGQYFLQF